MRINFSGQLADEKEINAGFIGCGSHSFRNLYPVFQYAPVNLVATCDLYAEKAKTFAKKFGAERSYTDYKMMLQKEKLDAVFLCLGYDAEGHPLYPKVAVECLNKGIHVWIEKPPAATCHEIEQMQEASRKNKKIMVTGLKKIFFPANEHAKTLAELPEFGRISTVHIEYPQYLPTKAEFDESKSKRVDPVVSFLDHLCHPASLMVFLLGMPETLYYDRSHNGGGIALFKYSSGILASIALTHTGSLNCGMERTKIVSEKHQHILVENNIRVSLHRDPPSEGYGSSPNFFKGKPNEASAVWEPEFSLGQLYNKGLFLLGYYNEINEFARAILENREPVKGTLEQAWQVTRIFEAFFEGPEKIIKL